MHTICVMAQKGGAGKTTLAVHIGVFAEQQGKTVALIDLDEQNSLGDWWRSRETETPILVEPTIAELPKVIKAAKKDGIDLVIIDTPPHAISEATKAINVSDFVIIPCRPAILDLRAINKTVELMKTTKKKGGIVLNHCPPARGVSEASLVKEARLGLVDHKFPVCDIAITQRVDFSHALIDGRAVTEFAPNGKAAKEIKALYKWIEENI